MSPGLPLAILPRIGALLRLLGSDQDHEALAAVKALQRTLTGVGADLHSLADAIEHPPVPMIIALNTAAAARRARNTRPTGRGSFELQPEQRRQVVDALAEASARGVLSEWELGFVASVIPTLQSGWPRVSSRQREIIDRILDRMEARRR